MEVEEEKWGMEEDEKEWEREGRHVFKTESVLVKEHW